MKKILILAILIGVAQLCFGQLSAPAWQLNGNKTEGTKRLGTTNNQDVSIVTDDSVRIKVGKDGITTVTGTLKYVDGNQSSGKILTSSSTGVATWQVAPAGGWGFNGTTVGSEKWIGTVDNYDFPIRTNNSEKVRIKSNGTVGIGTISPSARLSVQTPSNAEYGFSIGNATYSTSGSDAFRIYQGNTGEILFGSTGSDERMKLETNGRFGINMVGASAATLHVRGLTSTDIFKASNATFADAFIVKSTGETGIGTGSPSAKLEVSQSSYNTVAKFNGYFGGSNFDAFTIDANGNTISESYSRIRSGLSFGASAWYDKTVLLPDDWDLSFGNTDIKNVATVTQIYNTNGKFKFTNQYGDNIISTNSGAVTIYGGTYAAITLNSGSNLISHNYTYMYNGLAFGSGTTAVDNTIVMPATWNASFGGSNSGSTVNIAAGAHTNALSLTGKTLTSGDIVVDDATKGIVLKDAAGTPHYWRVTVSTGGVLTTTDLGTTIP